MSIADDGQRDRALSSPDWALRAIFALVDGRTTPRYLDRRPSAGNRAWARQSESRGPAERTGSSAARRHPAASPVRRPIARPLPAACPAGPATVTSTRFGTSAGRRAPHDPASAPGTAPIGPVGPARGQRRTPPLRPRRTRASPGGEQRQRGECPAGEAAGPGPARITRWRMPSAAAPNATGGGREHAGPASRTTPPSRSARPHVHRCGVRLIERAAVLRHQRGPNTTRRDGRPRRPSQGSWGCGNSDLRPIRRQPRWVAPNGPV